MTNKSDSAPRTAYKYVQKRWFIETRYREMKQFVGLEATYSGRKDYLKTHNMISYFGRLLFQPYDWQKLKISEKRSTE
ncbi:MAG: hypothetical protein ACTSR3_14905 [Candidatus Helarchaeota archaeon]